MSSEEIAGRFLAMMHPEIFSEQPAPLSRPHYERPVDGPRGRGDDRRGSRPSSRKFDRPAWTPRPAAAVTPPQVTAKVERPVEHAERPERSERPRPAAARREPFRPARVERADAFDRKKPYTPYRAPRSEKADQEKAARPARPMKKRSGSILRAPGSKWQMEQKNNKKKGGNYPPRRKVLGYSKES
jgi:hypothetical protein